MEDFPDHHITQKHNLIKKISGEFVYSKSVESFQPFLKIQNLQFHVCQPPLQEGAPPAPLYINNIFVVCVCACLCIFFQGLCREVLFFFTSVSLKIHTHKKHFFIYSRP